MQTCFPKRAANLRRVRLHLEKNKLAESILDLEKAIAIYPNFPEAQIELGTAYMDAKEWDKAELALKQALELAPHTQS